MSVITNFQRTERIKVARNVIAECARAGYSPATRFLADALDVHDSTIRRKNAGDSAYDTDELATIAAALQVPVAVFFIEPAPLLEAASPAEAA